MMRPEKCPEHIQEWIVKAAVKDRHDNIYTKDPPADHSQIIYVMVDQYKCTLLDTTPNNQGFITNTGRFVNRYEARNIALSAGQIKNFNTLSDQLFANDIFG